MHTREAIDSIAEITAAVRFLFLRFEDEEVVCEAESLLYQEIDRLTNVPVKNRATERLKSSAQPLESKEGQPEAANN